ncbi:MAG: phospholipase D-like domain-containing protein, partial [Candidatus Brocadiaceae bacterium]|nr:phospholipase D-like domain-containing protein [Candidatus Brocadiaceae bacterium]
MSWKRAYISVLLGMVGAFLFVQARAFSSEVYFAPTEIKGQILRAIEECRESVDIAVLDITSKDILNALIKAQERGVRVRIVVDRKRALRKGLLSHRDKDFVIKVLVQKGIMHNNFAIFDCKLLTTGSYYWNEHVAKFSRDNAIFTDETKLLVKYQREFDRLFHEGITTDIKESVPVAEEKARKIDEKPTVDISKDIAAGERPVVSKYEVVITETSDGYINMNFEEFNTIFGVASDLPDEQKEAMWSRCVGKRVKWRGKVNYIGWGLVTGWMLG